MLQAELSLPPENGENALSKFYCTYNTIQTPLFNYYPICYLLSSHSIIFAPLPHTNIKHINTLTHLTLPAKIIQTIITLLKLNSKKNIRSYLSAPPNHAILTKNPFTAKKCKMCIFGKKEIRKRKQSLVFDLSISHHHMYRIDKVLAIHGVESPM